MRLFLFVYLVMSAGIACADTGGDIADDINNVICLFVRLIWLVTGSLMALVIIFAGVKWLVSGEDPCERASAKNFIISAFVGLIVIFTAVPVVDYLVGSTLGYGFRCGFFPELDSSVFESRDSWSEGVVDPSLEVKSDSPSFPDLFLSSVSLSGNPVSGDVLSVCFVVGEKSGIESAGDVLVSAYLVDEWGNSREACSTSISFIGAGAFKEAACSFDSELLEEMGSDPSSYVLEARVDPLDSVAELVEEDNNVFSSGLAGVPVSEGCGMRLGVLATNMEAIVYAGVSKDHMAKLGCGSIDAYVSQPFYLDGSHSTAWSGSPIIKYTWFVDDRVVHESSSPYHELVFDSFGTYYIRLEIAAGGGKYTYTRDSGRCTYINVRETPPGFSPANPSGDPAFNFFDVVIVPMGYDFPREWDDYVNQVNLVRNHWLAASPFKECSDKETRVVFHLIDVDCTDSFAYAPETGYTGIWFKRIQECAAASSYAGKFDYIHGLYNGYVQGFSGMAPNCPSGILCVSMSTSKRKLPDGSVLDNEDAFTHELGHNLGFHHCSLETCVMHSRSHSAVDFCPDCYAKIKAALAPYLVGCES